MDVVYSNPEHAAGTDIKNITIARKSSSGKLKTPSSGKLKTPSSGKLKNNEPGTDECNVATANATANANERVEVFPHSQQVATVNQLFFGETDRSHAFYSALISKKCMGYKQQDAANSIYDPRWFVTHDEVVELLVASKLKCYYCRHPCYIHYTESFYQEQWTLERLSNDQGHNRENVVISCLKCNLNRGTKSSDKFRLGKQIRFMKTF